MQDLCHQPLGRISYPRFPSRRRAGPKVAVQAPGPRFREEGCLFRVRGLGSLVFREEGCLFRVEGLGSLVFREEGCLFRVRGLRSLVFREEGCLFWGSGFAEVGV